MQFTNTLHPRNFPIILVFLVMFSGFSPAQTQPEAGTGVEGTITVGPVQGGPSRPGLPDSKAFANAAFVVENEKGPVTSFTTDNKGRFRILLAPGHYTVAMKDKKGGIGHYGPFEVDVVAGNITKVQWHCDTGMR
jgi:hypothetical protein